jgi:hypothetical protein
LEVRVSKLDIVCVSLTDMVLETITLLFLKF